MQKIKADKNRVKYSKIFRLHNQKNPTETQKCNFNILIENIRIKANRSLIVYGSSSIRVRFELGQVVTMVLKIVFLALYLKIPIPTLL